ncbi:MAG TPA: glutathione S-transferase family protein [Burkholderiales bacterium]|nr:glutathione S-transferase family protein [Burkholderiales bacterium]
MGMMVDGVWRDVWYDTRASGGAFVRAESAFHGSVTADGTSGFPAESGRYHLYVSFACPWAHRTLAVRALKGLEDAVPVSAVDPDYVPDGWKFTGAAGTTLDRANGCRFLHEVYRLAKADYTGRVTVPVLWDRKTRTIVNNESSEIIRMLNREFDAFANRTCPDLYPAEQRAEIDAVNDRVYRTVNNGVYRAGFATAQDKYDEAVTALFESLDWLEARLATRRWLCGNRFTEADVRLWTTLVRFDAVYNGHFKCNLRRLVDYPALWGFTRDVYALPGIAATVDMAQIKEHYYRSQVKVNPTRIVAKGPILDLRAPHDRARLGPAPQ